jgi:hypothetical protein
MNFFFSSFAGFNSNFVRSLFFVKGLRRRCLLRFRKVKNRPLLQSLDIIAPRDKHAKALISGGEPEHKPPAQLFQLPATHHYNKSHPITNDEELIQGPQCLELFGCLSADHLDTCPAYHGGLWRLLQRKQLCGHIHPCPDYLSLSSCRQHDSFPLFY